MNKITYFLKKANKSSSVLKQLAGKLTYLSDELEQKLEECDLLILKEGRTKTASSHPLFDLVSKNTNVNLKELRPHINPKYLGTESSRLKLATGSVEKANEVIKNLKLAYQNNDTSKSNIKIGNIIADDGQISIFAVGKEEVDLSFSLSSYGSRYLMKPIGKLAKALHPSIVSNAGHIANTLDYWSSEIRALGYLEPTDKVKTAAFVGKYKQSPLLEDIEEQSNFVSVAASDIVPNDPNWIKSASIKELSEALDRIKTIKKSASLAKGFKSTENWAKDWEKRLSEAISHRKIKSKKYLRKKARKKYNELKKILQVLKKY